MGKKLAYKYTDDLDLKKCNKMFKKLKLIQEENFSIKSLLLNLLLLSILIWNLQKSVPDKCCFVSLQLFFFQKISLRALELER